MRVQDVMTSEVVSVRPGTPLKEVAARLVERGISGLPVCEGDGRVVGVLSEKDILFKEMGPAERGGGPLAWFAVWPAAAAAKANARTAADAMSSPALTIEPHRAVAAAARTMVERNVHRLPVVDARGRLVGIVARADLVRAFARPDAEIAHEIEHDLIERSLWVPAGTVSVLVERGEVALGGVVESRSIAESLPRLVACVPGVVGVRSSLVWREEPRARRRDGLAAAL
jgi:CBS domain-containing protein